MGRGKGGEERPLSFQYIVSGLEPDWDRRLFERGALGHDLFVARIHAGREHCAHAAPAIRTDPLFCRAIGGDSTHHSAGAAKSPNHGGCAMKHKWSAMGVLSLPAATLATNADPAVRAAWLDDMFLPPEVLEWPLNVVVVRSGGRTVLIDAGIGVEYPDFPRAGRLALRLEAAGIDPASVT